MNRRTKKACTVHQQPNGLSAQLQSAILFGWRAWAEAFGKRHGHIFLRNRMLSMVLAQRLSALYSRSTQFRRTVVNLFPNIRLAIRPTLLGDTTNKGGQEAGALTKRSTLGSTRLFLDRSNNYSETKVQSYGPTDSLSPLAPRVLPSSSSIVNNNAAAWSPANTMLPLTKVLARTRIDLEFPVLSRRIEVAGTEGIQRLLQSVARERYRVEGYGTALASQMSLANHVRHDQPKIPTVAETEQVFETRYGAQGGAMLIPNGTNVPLDVEKLTEQVIRNLDSRLVAHRERTGRVF
jgi:hypothetical protein